jgi:hypothetical protein
MNPDFIEFVQSLNDKLVRYLVVGGMQLPSMDIPLVGSIA